MRKAIADALIEPRSIVGSRESSAVMLFLIAAAASFALSVSLWFSGNESQGIFVGLWVPSILSLGALVLGGRR